MAIESKLVIIAVILVIIGALNWGWIGITSNNVVSVVNNTTFKNESFERLIYFIIGLAGLYLLFKLPMLRKISITE